MQFNLFLPETICEFDIHIQEIFSGGNKTFLGPGLQVDLGAIHKTVGGDGGPKVTFTPVIRDLNCFQEFIEIYDGPLYASPLLGKICNGSNLSYVSSSNTLTLDYFYLITIIFYLHFIGD
uniref:Uncharacterized protein n=1 Tax=Gopherus evgoodei TaxID=1825980 RepID=A0A8C4WEG5_9SAUR